jgi:hypothetical protein
VQADGEARARALDVSKERVHVFQKAARDRAPQFDERLGQEYRTRHGANRLKCPVPPWGAVRVTRRGKAVLNKSAVTKMMGALWQLKGASESKGAG